MDSSRAVISITPTFFLRGVDPIQVLTRYLDGTFQVPDVNLGGSLPESEGNLRLTPAYGTDSSSAIYALRDKAHHHLIYTTNHGAYTAAQDETPPPSYPCPWCRQQARGPTIGPPVRMHRVMTGTSEHLYFDIDTPIYCTFQCCLADLRQQQGNLSTQNPLYLDTETMLKLMYQRLYPDKPPLRPAPDWRLLTANGGCLPPDDYYGNSQTFLRTGNITCLPIKVEYTTHQRNTIAMD